MKSEIFSRAIHFRNAIRFLYCMSEIVVEPYFICCERTGKKYLYGRVPSSNQVKKFEFSSIVNIKVLKDRKFSPLIPINNLSN
jgi:hypothetical protein